MPVALAPVLFSKGLASDWRVYLKHDGWTLSYYPVKFHEDPPVKGRLNKSSVAGRRGPLPDGSLTWVIGYECRSPKGGRVLNVAQGYFPGTVRGPCQIWMYCL